MYSLALQADAKILLGGYFTQVKGEYAYYSVIDIDYTFGLKKGLEQPPVFL